MFGNPSLLTVAEMKRHLDYYNVTGVSRIAHVLFFLHLPIPIHHCPTHARCACSATAAFIAGGWVGTLPCCRVFIYATGL